mgnify:FL=1
MSEPAERIRWALVSGLLQRFHLVQVLDRRFGGPLEQAACCELFDWRASAAGRLVEIIVLDQFSRNVDRGTPRAFAQDPLALGLA